MANYTVKKGDTLSAIAQQYGTTYQEIAKANGISNPNMIYAGQTLNIGDSTDSQSSTSEGSSSGTSVSAPEETKSPAFSYEPYKPSDTVAQAEAMLKEQLAQKPGAYTSAWQAQLQETLDKILNREKFSYDLNGDALYQQYKDQAVLQGQQASMDVMGQAAAMTGGYGNSYAQQVGQQTYQGYLQQLNDKVPELYQLALDQYNREGDEMHDQASLMAGMEEQDYGRYRDSVSDYYTELGRLTEDARYKGELDYGMYRDQVSDSKWQAEFDEAKRQYDQAYELQNGSKNSTGDNGDYVYTGDGYDNEGLSENAIKAIQLSLGLEADGKWGPKSRAAAGGRGAKEAYNLWNQGKLGKSVNQEIFDARKEDDGTLAGFTGTTYSEAVSYAIAHGVDSGYASSIYDKATFSRKKSSSSPSDAKEFDTYEEYLQYAVDTMIDAYGK